MNLWIYISHLSERILVHLRACVSYIQPLLVYACWSSMNILAHKYEYACVTTHTCFIWTHIFVVPVYVQIPECGSIGLLVCRFVDVWVNMHAFICFFIRNMKQHRDFIMDFSWIKEQCFCPITCEKCKKNINFTYTGIIFLYLIIASLKVIYYFG